MQAHGDTARVGIAVRTQNRPYFLRRTLADIAAQDFDDLLVHIVNDGGDAAVVDGVVASVDQALRARISVTHNETAHGRSAAANEGIRALDTEFVILHDDDDLWSPRFLSETVAWMDAHPEDSGVVVRTDIVYEVKTEEGFTEVDRAPFWPQLQQITYSDLLQVNRAVPIAVLYRRDLHERLGYYREDLHAVEDWEFYLRVTLDHRIGLLDGPPLAFWMQRVSTRGSDGNSIFELRGEHDLYDARVRDELLRAHVRDQGPGLALYLTKFIQDEVARQLGDRRGLMDVVRGRARRWRERKRAR